MAKPVRTDPRSPDEWIVIAERELKNIGASYQGKTSNDAKIDHSLRAVEAALKAIAWKHHKWTSWPGKEKGHKFLYGHDLNAILTQCGQLRTSLRLTPAHWASWQTIANIELKHARYSPTVPSDAETNAIAKSVRHPTVGVVPWLIEHYHKMT